MFLAVNFFMIYIYYIGIFLIVIIGLDSSSIFTTLEYFQ